MSEEELGRACEQAWAEAAAEKEARVLAENS
jgi:hypothetical protein